MTPPRQLMRIALVLLFKLLLLALIAPFIVLSSFMFVSPFLKLGFSWPPFLMASATWITCSALIAYRRRDWGPVAMGLATIATAGVIYLHGPATLGNGAQWVLAAFAVPAAISFVYRNRFTEPMLVFPALIVLSAILTDILFPAALLLWAYFAADYPLGLKDVVTTLESLGSLLAVAPTALLYWLGKHGYAPWLERLRMLWPRRPT